MSGSRAVEIAARIFAAPSGPLRADMPSHTLTYGHIVESGDVVDEVLLSVMRAPRTYTREDIAEINCHGGITALRRVLELVLREGARIAEPGEFTLRAFLNGRIDLAQAEAVLDIVRARSERSLRAGVRQLEGNLSKRLHRIQHDLSALLALLEAGLDFPDESLALPGRNEIAISCRGVRAELRQLLESAERGVFVRDGVSVLIAGKPNVGKSSLMNALLERERVIVAPVPGTTRDVVEDGITIDGIAVRLWDSAGLGSVQDAVATQGMEKTRSYLGRADLILLVIDSSRPLTGDDSGAASEIGSGRRLYVLNKIDLPRGTDSTHVSRTLGPGRAVEVSALTGQGIEKLRNAIADMVWRGEISQDADDLVTNIRHRAAIADAETCLAKALVALDSGISEEFVAADVRRARDKIEEILGTGTADDVLDLIFREFCVGK